MPPPLVRQKPFNVLFAAVTTVQFVIFAFASKYSTANLKKSFHMKLFRGADHGRRCRISQPCDGTSCLRTLFIRGRIPLHRLRNTSIKEMSPAVVAPVLQPRLPLDEVAYVSMDAPPLPNSAAKLLQAQIGCLHPCKASLPQSCHADPITQLSMYRIRRTII